MDPEPAPRGRRTDGTGGAGGARSDAGQAAPTGPHGVGLRHRTPMRRGPAQRGQTRIWIANTRRSSVDQVSRPADREPASVASGEEQGPLVGGFLESLKKLFGG